MHPHWDSSVTDAKETLALCACGSGRNRLREERNQGGSEDPPVAGAAGSCLLDKSTPVTFAPDWLTKIKTPSPERERGRKREGETGRKKIPDWFSLGHKFIQGAGGGKVTDSLTRSLPMGEGGSPKGYGGAVPKRRKKKKATSCPSIDCKMP